MFLKYLLYFLDNGASEVYVSRAKAIYLEK